MSAKMTNENKRKMKRTVTQISLNIAVIASIFLFLNINFLVSPQDNMHTTNNAIKFEWIGMSNVKLDENPQFTSPIEIGKSNPAVELKPGTYYWKASLSRTRTFVIESEVALDVKPALVGNETAYRIENQGNTKILLNIIGLITGRVVLEPSAVTYEKNVSDIEKILAEQND